MLGKVVVAVVADNVSSTERTVGTVAADRDFFREELRFFGGGGVGGGGGGVPTSKAITGVVAGCLRVGVGGGTAALPPLAGEDSATPTGSSPTLSSTPEGLTPPGSRWL